MDYKFTISPEIFEKCTLFAKNSVNTSSDKYARRNQFNLEKIIKDIRVGKIGEEGVYSLLIDKFPNLSKPDHNIYQKGDKSWDPDLKDNDSNIRVAVKSQDISSCLAYGESWVFQWNNGGKYDCDSGVFKEIDDNHYVAFVAVNTPKKIGEIRALVKIQWLHDNNLFKPMKLQKLQGNKLAVYMDDLEKFKNELWQI